MHERLIMILVAILAMLAPFSIDTYLPSFPDIQADLHATPVQRELICFQKVSFELTKLVQKT